MDRPLRLFTFSGRADRLEFAWNLAFCAVFAPVTGLALQAVNIIQVGPGIFLAIWACFIALHLAAAVRRFHDFGLSCAWPIILSSLPVLLPISPILMLLYCSEICFGPKLEISDDGRGIGSAILAGKLAITVFPIGTLIYMFLAFRRSDPLPNLYGPPPSQR